MASLNAVHSTGAGEAEAARAGAGFGVLRAGGISRIDWAGVEGTKFLTGRKDKGAVLRIDTGVDVGKDRLLGGLPGRDFTHDKRLFRCTGNSVLRLLVPFLLLLLSNDCKEGKAYRAGASSGTLPSIDLWILTDLLEAYNTAMLFSSPKIGSSISPKFKKQERWDSSSLILSSSALAVVCKPDIYKAFAAPASFVVSSTSNSPTPMSSTYSAVRIPSKISVISASRSACSAFVSCSFV